VPTATPQNPCAGFDILSIPTQERVQFQNGQLTQIGSGRLCDIQAKTIAFSPDGNSLALAAYDGIRLYDAHTGELRLRMKPGETGQTWNVAFSPDGRFLAAISTWGEVTLWDVSTSALLQSLNKPGEAVAWTISATGVAFSGNGRLLVAWAGNSASDNTHIWDISDIFAPVLLTSLGDSGNMAAISPDGQYLVTGTDGGWAKVELQTGSTVSTSAEREGVAALAFSPDGRILYTSNWTHGLTSMWDASTGQRLYTFDPCIDPCVIDLWADEYVRFDLSGDGTRLVEFDGSHNQIIVWDTQHRKQLWASPTLNLKRNIYIADVAISPGGALVAALADLQEDEGQRILLWRLPP
jgi:WD40 repeat protein